VNEKKNDKALIPLNAQSGMGANELIANYMDNTKRQLRKNFKFKRSII